jgi:sialic acid synthase SpsE
MKAGEKFTEKNLRVIRPGLGLEPRYYETFLGKKIGVDAKKGTPLSFDLLF